MKKQYGFCFESDRCLKCWACEIACKQWHGIKAGTYKLRKVVEVTNGAFPDVKRTFISSSCRHCSKPPCAAACPTGAISQRDEDGVVLVDDEKCIGCYACLEACPFGAPQFDTDGLMHICDMCLDRLEKGQKPICAETCPTGALHWGTLEELSDLTNKKAANKMAMR
jgi:anaerobic dimethyl sulfoxide reductase subunit B (iron-sulfur subunit)